MEVMEGGGGGPAPSAGENGEKNVFPSLSEDAAYYVAGVWEGYADAIGRLLQGPSAVVDGMQGNWLGERSDRFYQWWEPASSDMSSLRLVAQMMTDAFRKIGGAVPGVNSLCQQAGQLILANTEQTTGPFNGSTGGRYAYLQNQQGQTMVHKYGTPIGDNWDSVVLEITGFDIETLGSGVASGRPSWLNKVWSLLRQAQTAYNNAANAAASQISTAPALLKNMSQIKEIDRNAPSTGTSRPWASLNDPTWTMLAGRGVFRPTLPPGFNGDPFDGKDIPSWYKPTVMMDVEKFVGDHVGDIINIASLIAVLVAPEGPGEGIAGGLEALGHAYTAADGVVKAINGQWVDAGADGVSLVIGVKWPSKSVRDALEPFSLGHDFSKGVQVALQKSEKDVSPKLAKHFGDYVQDHTQDWIKEHLKTLAGEGEKPDTVKVPPAVMRQIFAQAAQQIGAEESMTSAGLSP